MASPRIVIATLGMDQHENGAIAVQRMLMESQMMTSYLGVLNTPVNVIDHAQQFKADVIGISCHSWEYLTLVPELLDLLKEREFDCSVVIGGSIITPKDSQSMLAQGVDGVFDATASQGQIVDSIRDLVISRQNT
jgi:methylmalonyl-CoA mutase C-terminal domain/subunit